MIKRKPKYLTFSNLTPKLSKKMINKFVKTNEYQKFYQRLSTLDRKEMINFENNTEYRIEKVNDATFEIAKNFLIDNDFYPDSRDRWIKEYKKQKNKLGFLMFDNQKVIAHACIVYETDEYSILWGVLVDENYRGKGLAKIIVSHLCSYIFQQDKSKKILLYYTEDRIGNIYKNIGFVDKAELFSLERIEKESSYQNKKKTIASNFKNLFNKFKSKKVSKESSKGKGNVNFLLENKSKFILSYKKIVAESKILLNKFKYQLNDLEKDKFIAFVNEFIIDNFINLYNEENTFFQRKIDLKDFDAQNYDKLIQELITFLNIDSVFFFSPPNKMLFNMYVFVSVYSKIYKTKDKYTEEIYKFLDKDTREFFDFINSCTNDFEQKLLQAENEDKNKTENNFIDRYVATKIQLNYDLLLNYHWMKYVTGWFDNSDGSNNLDLVKHPEFPKFPFYNDPFQYKLENCELNELKIDEKFGYFDKYLITYESIVESDVVPFKEKVNFDKSKINDQIEQLNYAMNEPDIENIAIVGEFSSGKTSLIKNYVENDKKSSKNTIWIDWSSNDTENLKLEDNIAKQIIYQIPLKKQDQSKIKVKRKVSELFKIAAGFILAMLTCVFIAFFSNKEVVNYWNNNKIYLVVFLSFFVLLFTIIFYSITKLVINNFWRIKKISIKGNTTELEQNNSFLGKNIDDLIFIINNAGIKYIIFDNVKIDDDWEGALKTLNSLKEMIFLINKNKAQLNPKKQNEKATFVYCIEMNKNVNKLNKIFDYQIRLNSGLDESVIEKTVDNIQKSISTISGTNIIESGFPDYRFIQKDFLNKRLRKYFSFISNWKTLKNIQYQVINYDLISKNKFIEDLTKEIENSISKLENYGFYNQFKKIFSQMTIGAKAIEIDKWEKLKNELKKCVEPNCQYCAKFYNKYYAILKFKDSDSLKKVLAVENNSCEDYFKNDFLFNYLSDYFLFNLNENGFIDNNKRIEIIQKSQIRFQSLINFLGFVVYQNTNDNNIELLNIFKKVQETKKKIENYMLNDQSVKDTLNIQICKEFIKHLYTKIIEIENKHIAISKNSSRYYYLLYILQNQEEKLINSDEVYVIVEKIRQKIIAEYVKRHPIFHIKKFVKLKNETKTPRINKKNTNNKIIEELLSNEQISAKLKENVNPSDLVLDNKKLSKCHLIEHINIKNKNFSLNGSSFINSNLDCYFIEEKDIENLIDVLLKQTNFKGEIDKKYLNTSSFTSLYNSINEFRTIEFGLNAEEIKISKYLSQLICAKDSKLSSKIKRKRKKREINKK
ncbi:GNAT family N-acetyltransferase [Mycoplasmopsis gallinacea]|uniref:GNAT family N-acetyltransferase n=1 Tax=Mycoplasmopsis gallinacea TaxID=29556 RepID=A0A6H0V2Q0_9BACT|nr:GNAT family N-acetyltransferase [Mycoplasmopsis gallinacea]QIW62472.1 GNAT family N-acetyltransferase [Mycoplasmopsis gallinacea]